MMYRYAKVENGETTKSPTTLDAENLTIEKTELRHQEEESYEDESPVFTHKGGGTPSGSEPTLQGGLGGFSVRGEQLVPVQKSVARAA